MGVRSSVVEVVEAVAVAANGAVQHDSAVTVATTRILRFRIANSVFICSELLFDILQNRGKVN